MNSLATEAVPMIWLLPLEISSWVLRSRMPTERVAPLAAAWSVVCWMRARKPPSPPPGSASSTVGAAGASMVSSRN